MATTSKEILRRIRLRGAGSVFTGSDFLSAASRASVDQTLSRLARQGVIRRLAQGLYDYPQTHEKLGVLSPAPDAIASALARRDNVRIQPSGDAAANALGLSTQVPSKIIYLTDGRSRSIRVGGQTIEFRHVPPSRLITERGAAPLTASALRHIGREEAQRPEVKRTLSKALKSEDKRRLMKSARYMPTWMQLIVREISESNTE